MNEIPASDGEAEVFDRGAASITFFVHGRAAAQGSKRYVGHSNAGRAILLEQSKKVGPWRKVVETAAFIEMKRKGLQPFTDPLKVILEFVMPRPVSTPKSKTPPAVKRPDLDKLTRAVFDSLTSVVWLDDSQVVYSLSSKRIAEIGETAGLYVSVVPWVWQSPFRPLSRIGDMPGHVPGIGRQSE